MLAPLAGSDHLELKEQTLKSIMEKKDEIEGVVVYDMTTSAAHMPIFEMVNREFENFEKNKLRVLAGEGSFIDILHGLCFGFNSFETNYAFKMASEGKSINFSPKNWEKEFLEKRKTEDFETNIQALRDRDWSKYDMPLLDLVEPKYMEDHDDLLWAETPECVKGYSKADVCHLLNNKEMTGKVLITMLNARLMKELVDVVNGPTFDEYPVQMTDYFLKFFCVKQD